MDRDRFVARIVIPLHIEVREGIIGVYTLARIKNKHVVQQVDSCAVTLIRVLYNEVSAESTIPSGSWCVNMLEIRRGW